MEFGMIEVMNLLFTLILMLIGKKIGMIEKAPVEKHSSLVKDWYLGQVRNRIVHLNPQ